MCSFHLIIWKSDLLIFFYGAPLRSLWEKYMLNNRRWRCFCEKVVLAAQKYHLETNFWIIQTIFLMIFFVRELKKKLFRRILMVCTTYIEKTFLFLFQLQICGRSSACRKKIRCRRMDPVPPFWDICQWQNFLGNLNTWPNTSSKRFSLLPFL